MKRWLAGRLAFALSTNPLIRGVNPDIALLHITRALPFVDDSRVVITGGSAGGWMTLMLAAETFPLAGAAARRSAGELGIQRRLFLQAARQGAPMTGWRCPASRLLRCGHDARCLPDRLRHALR